MRRTLALVSSALPAAAGVLPSPRLPGYDDLPSAERGTCGAS